MQARDDVSQTRELRRLDMRAHVHIFGSSQLKGPVEGPYCICVFSRAEAVILDCNVPLSLLSSITELLGSEQASYEHTFS